MRRYLKTEIEYFQILSKRVYLGLNGKAQHITNSEYLHGALENTVSIEYSDLGYSG